MVIIARIGLIMSAANVLFYTSVLSAIPSLLEQNAKIKIANDIMEASRQYGRNDAEEWFDYIVVGGGSAGSVVTNRLSRRRDVTVLLLDIGGDPDPIQQVPMHASLQVTPETDFGYHTVPQEDCFYSTDNMLHEIRGRGLGGSGNMNYMIYQRGPGKGYDEWAEMAGDEIWAWESVLQYFKRAEKYVGNHQPMDRRFHSGNGNIIVSEATFKPSAEPFFAACRELGINVEDVNTGIHNSPVVDYLEFKINRGRRWGPYPAFLRPIMGRPNLRIYRYSRVIKVNVDSNMRATGVTYVRHGVTQTVMARREVILCAGALDTPKILMLSGIGPKDHLESLEIPVIKDLPVGKNHQDHLATVLDRIEFDQPGVAYVPPRDLTPRSFYEYQTQGIGPLSIPGGFFATGYYSTPQNADPEIPDIQYFFSGTYSFGNPMCLPNWPLDKIGEMTEVPDSNLIVVTLTIPHTVDGEVTLKSSDPNDDMLIDPKFFSNAEDMPRFIEGMTEYGPRFLIPYRQTKRIMAGIKYVLSIYENSTVYNKLGAKLVLTVPEMCEDLEYRSDAFWDCYIRVYTGTIWHPVGTCKMGKEDDPTTVVDSKLRVLGIPNLRVVDGSIMPKIVNCNTQAPIYMIAEVASHLILGDLEWNA